MSEFRLETYIMPAARLGPENPLPPLDICLPYGIQDDYDREKIEREFKTVVLENDFLRATFLIELGGRLWSLYHKKAETELLYVNPVFQPGNLAIRNAWFSGGVEWNMGIIGHSVFTCSPVFVANLKMDDGTPVLRMYEWDRLRMATYQIDAFLPDDSDFLFLRMRIINPHDHEIPMYWWSNMAVPEIPGGRILVPAESAYKYGYQSNMDLVPIPVSGGVDLSHPTNFNRSADCFYCIDPQQQPWITSLDKSGRGLIQTSTKRLRGRKLFVWGMEQGGRNWQEFLSQPGSAYIEIQAGLARTQSEYLQMPARADWSWLEAYGLMQTNPDAAYGKDWKIAYQSVDAELKKVMPPDKLEQIYSYAGRIADQKPDEIIQRGSGWGALERLRREKNGEKPFCSDSLIFDDKSLTEEQKPWLELLNDGSMPDMSTTEKPGGWMIQAQWREMLEKAVKNFHSDHWLSWLHLGIMYYSQENFEKAGKAWQKSLERHPSPWAYRNLAVLAKRNKNMDEAADLLLKAIEMSPDIYSLALECCKALIDSGRPEEMLNFMDKLSPEIRSRGRMNIMEARAAMKKGDLDRVEEILLSKPSVADVREGEVTLSNLWFEMHEKRIAKTENIAVDDELRKRVRREFKPPAWLDFRQST
ncbi:DUF5107 domain-containing protein [Candidatus Poribacteria bacterium]|nr:DUF5107 domain-containing protein [Candidatus Poribacteria bacterium]